MNYRCPRNYIPQHIRRASLNVPSSTGGHGVRNPGPMTYTNGRLLFTHYQIVSYSDKPPSFFGNILKNFKEEYSKNQETIQKSREDLQKLKESDTLKEAKKKFQRIESQTEKSDTDSMSGLAGRVKDTLSDYINTKAVGRGSEMLQILGEKAGGAVKAVSKVAEHMGKSRVYKAAASSFSQLKQEIGCPTLGGKVYKAPVELRKRKEHISAEGEAPIIAANEDATGVELLKDSKFSQSWQQLKESNNHADFMMKYEENDNPVVWGATILAPDHEELFSRYRLSEVLTEIIKMDPTFCQEQFRQYCQQNIIPTVLEAINRGELEILEDWCFEDLFNALATPIRQAKQLGYTFHSPILDIDKIDLVMGELMEQGPVLVITFNCQQIQCLRDPKGAVVKGDPDEVLRLVYVWVLGRDQREYDQKTAWRLLELTACLRPAAEGCVAGGDVGGSTWDSEV